MLLSLISVYLLSLLALQDDAGSEFADLGKLLLIGFLAAVVLGLAFTFVRLRLRDKKPPKPGFISINSFQEKK
jgi:hypothetical protein